MPEGPSIVILKEQVQLFKGLKVLEVEGNTKIEKERFQGKKIVDFKSWGKHFLVVFPKFSLRIHFMLFGSYRINEPKASPSRLTLFFKNGRLDFYACSVQIIEEPLDTVYDWKGDVMNDDWDPKLARNKLKAQPNTIVCDALLDQNIFAGVGNIIKNEVLYRIYVHPKNTVGNLPVKQLNLLIKESRNYSFDFLQWKKAYVLKKNWLAHTKKKCKRCDLPMFKEYLGRTNRRTFFCNNCQLLYR